MAWYDKSWGYRVKLTVLNGKVDADLTDFPVYVDLSDLPAGFHSNVKTDGSDIRITTSDGVTECPREVVVYDSSGDTGELHFKAPSLANASDTDFYLYYGNANASDNGSTNPFGRTNVWSNGYAGVYHLQETVNNDASGYIDSTSNARHGTGTSMALTAPAGKLAGKCAELDGASDYISITGTFGSPAIMTLQAWGWNDTRSGRDELITVADWVCINMQDGSDQGFYYNGSYPTLAETLGSTGAWVMLHYMTNPGASSQKLYRNGAEVDSGAQSGAINYSGGGTSRIGTHAGAADSRFDGKVDEVRVSNVVRTATWISTEYNNQNDPGTFFTIGAQETAPTGRTASGARSAASSRSAASGRSASSSRSAV